MLSTLIFYFLIVAYSYCSGFLYYSPLLLLSHLLIGYSSLYSSPSHFSFLSSSSFTHTLLPPPSLTPSFSILLLLPNSSYHPKTAPSGYVSSSSSWPPNTLSPHRTPPLSPLFPPPIPTPSYPSSAFYHSSSPSSSSSPPPSPPLPVRL